MPLSATINDVGCSPKNRILPYLKISVGPLYMVSLLAKSKAATNFGQNLGCFSPMHGLVPVLHHNDKQHSLSCPATGHRWPLPCIISAPLWLTQAPYRTFPAWSTLKHGFKGHSLNATMIAFEITNKQPIVQYHNEFLLHDKWTWSPTSKNLNGVWQGRWIWLEILIITCG